MSSSKETIKYILFKLGNNPAFTTRAMFGEYALYANQKVVGLICDDTLFVKILPASKSLEKICDQDSPYPKAKLHYVVNEDQIDSIPNFPDILISLGESLK